MTRSALVKPIESAMPDTSRPTGPRAANRLTFWLAIPMLALAACSSEPDGDNLQVGAGGDRMTIGIPDRLQAASLHDSTDGTLSATVSRNGGTPVAMQISGTTASATLSDVPLGSSSFEIVFSFAHNTFGSFQVARASTTITVAAGDNPVTFQQNDYDFSSLDDDSDGVSNFDELVVDTNPTAPPTWGDMIWGKHKWTSSN